MSPRPGTPIVHPDLLGEVRTLGAKTRPETAQVRRPTRTTDAGGGTTNVWADVGDPVSARIVPLSRMRPSEREVASRAQGERLAVVAMPANTDVQLKDRIVIGTHTFEVVDDVSVGQSYMVETRVLVSEVGV